MLRTRFSLITRLLFYIFLTAFGLLWLLPVVFMLFTALKSPADLFSGASLFSIPKHIEWSNFTDAWLEGNMSVYMRNSMFIALVKVPAGIFIAALGAFALTRLNYKWSNPTFVLILIGMMIPVQVTLVPLSMFLKWTNLIDTHLGIILVYLGFGIPFAVLVLRGFFRTIPKELDDAARIDGCSDFGLFWRILLPIAMPAVATLVILDFLSTWNEFLLSQIFLTSNELRTIPSGLMIFKGEFGTNYGLMNAGVLISVIPILIIYLVFQKYFVQGLAGSVKG